MGTQEILLIIFSGLVTASTIIYAILTWRLVSETKRMRRVQTEPRVDIRIEPREEWIFLLELVIKNIGLGPAFDVRFSVMPIPLVKGSQATGQGTREFIDRLKEINCLQQGLSYLAPGQEVRTFLTSMAEDSEKKLDAALQVTTSYKGPTNEPYEIKYSIYVDELKGLEQIGRPPLYEIAENIEKLREKVEHLATGFNRIETNIYTSEDREEESAELEKHFAEIKAAAEEEESDSS